MATIIDGKAISEKIRSEVKAATEKLIKEKGVTPGLAVVLVGDNPASKVYVGSKEKACLEMGFYSEKHVLPVDASQDELLKLIDKLNKDKKIHGILVQLPLPKQINEDLVLEAISPEKDVDGFHPYNVGRLAVGKPLFQPCTPYGMMKMLEYSNISVEGKHAVIIGRSNIVGKPIALMLLQKSATVTICHSKTKDLKEEVKRADIVVAAIGKPGFVTGDMLKEGAVVLDVGINRLESGKLVGDVDFASAEKVASAITPVPGGVGPMTIAMLMYNTLESAKRV
ncbi:MAG: bifunctional methylenetetrahydrofolate dehydrogenase/methenyltetrahydrofolate cyclohydrolase FolD [Deltaproteobacteria bacterium]|nr:bifunctional methylenetetrahydrofolate dehydrogenase/methenyltetrahydrofolate cyclohydrolase FolD [Deltaproteobacteria bacterium]